LEVKRRREGEEEKKAVVVDVSERRSEGGEPASTGRYITFPHHAS
jgi:hypothetical protein